ncbi:MAG: NAD(+) synthase [Candidatus Omnitrophota bacterium]|jgi:NAD+ synthase
MKTEIEGWIRERIKSAGAKGALVGLSGGIDSAVAAALLCSSLGRKRVLALILPAHSSRQDAEDAGLIVSRFRLRSLTVDISRIYDLLLRKMLLPPGLNAAKKREKTAGANLKSRLRMSVFYYYANRLNYLVCGTGNRSEIMTGYFTKYGDGAADILPLGGLLKRQVRSLAEELGVPRRIIDKPPSAGLWPGQTDEAEMGVTYGEIDAVLSGTAGRKKTFYGGKTASRIHKMRSLSEHKRMPAAVFIPSGGGKPNAGELH